MPKITKTFSRKTKTGLHERYYVKSSSAVYYVSLIDGKPVHCRKRTGAGENVVDCPQDVLEAINA